MFATLLVLLVAVEHFYILVLEMFRWEHPHTRAIFGLDKDLAAKTKVMAANQGLYNGFLAAGLLWGLWQGAEGKDVTLFFLACVVVAGVYGGLTVTKRIVIVQALPAFVAMLAVLFL
jgi:putative membrane protein